MSTLKKNLKTLIQIIYEYIICLRPVLDKIVEHELQTNPEISRFCFLW